MEKLIDGDEGDAFGRLLFLGALFCFLFLNRLGLSLCGFLKELLFDTGEEGRGLLNGKGIEKLALLDDRLVALLIDGETECRRNRVGGLGHDWVEHDRYPSQKVGDETIQCHRFLGFALFHEVPGLVLIDRFVGDRQRPPELFEVAVDLHLKEQRLEFGQRGFGLRHLFGVVCAHVLTLNAPVEVFAAHPDEAVEEVAQIIPQIGVDPVDQCPLAEVAVPAEGDFPEHEVAEILQSVRIGDLFGVDDVPFGLGHFLTVAGPPAMSGDVFGQGHVKAHEKRWPVDRMEAKDVLADQVYPSRPILHEALVSAVAQSREVIHQGIEPDIHDVFGVIHLLGQFDSPVEARAGYREIFKTTLDEADHFVALGLGEDALRAVAVPRQ